MKYILILVLFCLSLGTLCSQHLPFNDALSIWLKNGVGLTEENGGVTLWENQVDNDCDALQSNSALTGELLYETYPGKVNVGFSKNLSNLELVNSNSLFSDQSFSVFYVGKVGDVGNIASLVGNFKPNADWAGYTGFRFACNSSDKLVFQYANPKWAQVTLGDVSPNSFFYFGFSIDSLGNYHFFDNQLEDIISGSISGEIEQGVVDLNFNLHLTPTGSQTYDHTEVAEFIAYDSAFTVDQMDSVRLWLSEEYADINTLGFSVSEYTPLVSTALDTLGEISLTFSKDLKQPITKYPKVYNNKVLLTENYHWSMTSSNILTLTPDEKWSSGHLISIVIDPLLESSDGDIFNGERDEYKFIAATGDDYGVEYVDIPTIVVRNNGTHNIPMKLVLPTERENKVPVQFWVHGGGWSGGTATNSYTYNSPHAEYLAKNLGVASVAIAYRCSGSDGNFTQAMEDVDAAYQWILENADTYNLDASNSFFSGGSAGTPLASLASQRYETVKAYVGFNGIYNFVKNTGPWGTGNSYGQMEPSDTANSAYYNLRDTPPATILMHGDADATISHQQSLLFAQEIIDNGGEAKTIIYPNQPHAFFNLGMEQYEDVLFEMVQFLKNHEIFQTDDLETYLTQNGSLVLKPYTISSNISENYFEVIVLNAELKMKIFNISGQVIKEITTLDSYNSIDLYEQPSGVYLMELYDKKQVFVEKIFLRKQ